jgi:hypothetical protein
VLGPRTCAHRWNTWVRGDCPALFLPTLHPRLEPDAVFHQLVGIRSTRLSCICQPRPPPCLKNQRQDLELPNRVGEGPIGSFAPSRLIPPSARHLFIPAPAGALIIRLFRSMDQPCASLPQRRVPTLAPSLASRRRAKCAYIRQPLNMLPHSSRPNQSSAETRPLPSPVARPLWPWPPEEALVARQGLASRGPLLKVPEPPWIYLSGAHTADVKAPLRPRANRSPDVAPPGTSAG